MDRSRKRKADTDNVADSASKRQKVPSVLADSTTAVGLRFIETLRAAKDKTGRSITTLFLELPNRRELPDYYQLIKLPIAIDTIEVKLQRNEYPNLTTVESDVKRMVANAKIYNDEKSIVFGDAERIRKLASNFMRDHNPAYQDPDYIAFPTPIPGEDSNGASSATPAPARQDSEKPRKPTITLSRRKSSMAPAPAPVAVAEVATGTPEVMDESDDFSGKTFQQAQKQLVDEMVKHQDDEGLEIFFPFVNLPPRSLVDYYKVIKKPLSLTGVRKRVRGQHGREPPTHVSDFKSWDAFEEEVATIWENARIYNEDGSDMYNLAGEFEEHFKMRLAVAKKAVDEPQQPRIKLNARPKPVLHLGSKASPAPGVSVDNEALARQKQMVQASANGHQTPQPQQPPSRSTSQVPTVEKPESSPAGAVKTEKSVGPSPALPAAKLASAAPEARLSPLPSAVMPPPRLPSGSPHPAALPVPIPAPPPRTFVDDFTRSKPVTEALLMNLNISTHPQLNQTRPFRLDIPPSPDFTHQSLTVMLPPSQYYLQITPTVSQQLSSGRQYKLFVTVNGARVTPSSKPIMNGDVISMTERKSVYDTALSPGVNRIEIEIVAVTGRGGGLETEKVSVFANLLRG